jgi:hypothetical protein
MTAEVSDAVADCGTFLEFVPGGYNWCLQPMVVGVNRPFKDGIRQNYYEFCIRNDFDRKPRREDVSQWVKDSFDGVKRQQIINTWRRIGLCDNDIDDDAASTNTASTTSGTSSETDDGVIDSQVLDILNLNLDDDRPAMTIDEIEAE